MYVIALVGKQDSGKSQTLNIVYKLLLLDGYKQVENLPHQFTYRVLGNPEQKDFTDIVQKKGKVVGIVTMGDYFTGDKVDERDTVKNLLKALYDSGCTIAICACTERKGDPMKNELEDYPYTVFHKSTTNNELEQWIKNDSDAQTIFNHI